jgi:histone acetyltransferase (RNA polymerase elongator complex component)
MSRFKKHCNIPIFIPEAACPHQCIFCNQHHITGKAKQPSVEEVKEIVKQHLKTISSGTDVEIAFFGGSFTGLDAKQQINYLTAVQPFLKAGSVLSIRCSTRPDYISDESVERLRQFGVNMIELGAQSFDEDVLLQSNRGHSVRDIHHAIAILKRQKMPFGLQMMIGLPGDTSEKAFYTAQEIVRLGAVNTRIYPCLVIKNTMLEQRYLEGSYRPQELSEAVALCAQLVTFFEQHKIKILRVGLHRTEGFDSKTTLVDGPYHPSFNELVESHIWREIFGKAIDFHHFEQLFLTVPKGAIGIAAGHKKTNRQWLEQHFKKVYFAEDDKLTKRTCHVHYS